ncbi:hypothetical protein GCM10018785_11250 [Streptomyces longispororuber]|uniref:WD40 repeat protein n=1 Tax=Streptomyces longispororuber TaxID=68230 RepID=A0A919DGM3_9ACTN|nr:hypothetical protein [Streptomyces longispororuber]GHE43455.1 hypothetical protein GCM10018785_11250 [Streptomyces longispororuber]
MLRNRYVPTTLLATVLIATLGAAPATAAPATAAPATADPGPRTPPAPPTPQATSPTPLTPRTERVSTAADGTQLDGPSYTAAISADGRRVAFVTRAADLGCGGYTSCLKVKDLATGALTGIDLGGGHLYGASLLSADGSRVAFTANQRFNSPYLHDLNTGRTERLWPEDPPGFNELGSVNSLSPDGTHVAYTIGNRRGDANFRLLYVRHTATGSDELISPPEEGEKGGASVSGDGTRVAYQIGGHSEGSEDTADVFLKASGAGRVPLDAGLGTAELVRITADGHRVLFNARGGLYAYDVSAGTTERVTEGRASAATDDGHHAVVSRADGPHLVDLRTGRATAVGPAGARVTPGGVSADGGAVVFGSTAPDLVPGDTNGQEDVFLRHTR